MNPRIIATAGRAIRARNNSCKSFRRWLLCADSTKTSCASRRSAGRIMASRASAISSMPCSTVLPCAHRREPCKAVTAVGQNPVMAGKSVQTLERILACGGYCRAVRGGGIRCFSKLCRPAWVSIATVGCPRCNLSVKLSVKVVTELAQIITGFGELSLSCRCRILFSEEPEFFASSNSGPRLQGSSSVNEPVLSNTWLTSSRSNCRKVWRMPPAFRDGLGR